MKGFQNFMEKYMLPVATKIQNNIYISAVSDGFSVILPIIILGAIFTLFGSMQFAPYQEFIKMIGFKTLISYVSPITTDLLALYTVFAIAYNLSLKKGLDKQAVIVGVLALAMFFLLLPTGAVHKLDSGEMIKVGKVISTEYLGSMGLFMSIIIGLLVPSIFNFVVKRGLVIKLPDGVPPTIAKSFNALIPAFIIAFIFCAIRLGVSFTPYEHANKLIYTLIGQPLVALGSNPMSMIILLLVQQLLWFFGLHGYMVIRPILQTVFIPLSLANLAAFEAGTALPNAITYQHFGTYAAIGGSGALLGLAILMAFASKSERYKALGRLSLPSTIFAINEPLIFGTPLVLNTILFIPFILSPILMFVIPYILQISGILTTLRGISLPLGTPVFAYGWIEGGLPVMLMQGVLVIVQLVLWFPFFKVLDKQALDEEQAMAANKAVTE